MTNTITVKVDASRAQAAFARAPEVMERHIDAKLARGAEEVMKDAMNRAPKAFSGLWSSFHAQRLGVRHYEVYQGRNYGRFVEEGTRPHFPNPDALRPWVERVLGVRGKEAADKAWMIARAIGRRGTRAQRYMQPAAEASTSRLFELVRQGVDEGLREVFGV